MGDYHDHEWGVPSHDDRQIFEMLTLEGAQAGLSWATILNRRGGYRRAFANFDPAQVARLTAPRLELLRQDTACLLKRLNIPHPRSTPPAYFRAQGGSRSYYNYQCMT